MPTKQELVFKQAEEALELEEYELEGKREFLSTDPLATYRVWVGNKRVGLEYFIGKKEGELKSSFTLKEARALASRPNWFPHTRTKDNRIPREVVLDELAGHFMMSEQELIDNIEELAHLKTPMARKRIAPKVEKPVTELREGNTLSALLLIGILYASHKILKTVLRY